MSIGEFISQLEGQQRIITMYWHERFIDHHGLIGKINFGVPMYYHRSHVCYINPIRKVGGVELAFWRGWQLSNDQGLLDRRGRKLISGAIFHRLDEVPERMMDEIVQEALILDEQLSAKRTSVRKRTQW